MKVQFDKKTISVDKSATVLDILRKLNINPEAVLVVRNNELITENDSVKDGDILETIKVVSGG